MELGGDGEEEQEREEESAVKDWAIKAGSVLTAAASRVYLIKSDHFCSGREGPR